MLKQLRQINDIGYIPFRIPRFLRPVFPYLDAALPVFTYVRLSGLKRGIRSEMNAILDATELNPGAGYAARLLDCVGERLGMPYLIGKIEQELHELQERIRHERGESLERMVMYLIAIEVLRSFWL